MTTGIIENCQKATTVAGDRSNFIGAKALWIGLTVQVILSCLYPGYSRIKIKNVRKKGVSLKISKKCEIFRRSQVAPGISGAAERAREAHEFRDKRKIEIVIDA